MARVWSNPSSQGLDNRHLGKRGKVRHIPVTPELQAKYGKPSKASITPLSYRGKDAK